MGLFSLFGGPKTKAEWDQKIISLNNSLAHAKASLAEYKARPRNYSQEAVAAKKKEIERIKADIANAKIERRNAPK